MKPKPQIATLRGIAFFFFVMIASISHAQSVAINTTGNSADSSAIFDVSSSSKGVLIPRVSLTSLTAASPLTLPATSLMVYNTNAAISGDNGQGTGYYYNAGTPAAPSWTKLVEQGVRWDDLRVTLDKGSNAAQIDYLSGSTGPQIWYFRNNDGLESMSFTVQLPHTWVEGSTLYPHLHWLPRTTATGNIEWNFEYSWVNYDAATPQVFPAITTTTVVASGPFTARTHLITPLTAANAGIDGTGKKISSILICRLWRNSSNTNDTYNYDAGVLFMDFHIEVDGYGSHSPYIK